MVQMANMKDVAKLSGVSIATVSNLINGTKPVKSETKKKIVEAITTLGFFPNAAGRNLKKQSSNEIGVILPNISDSYYTDVFKGIEKILHSHKYYLDLAFSDEIPDKEINILDGFLRKNVSGIIIFTCQPENYNYFQENFTKRNIPLVCLDRKIEVLDTNFIYFDNYAILEHLTSSLFKMSFDSIGLITGPKEYFCEAECIRGFEKAFLDNSMNLNRRHILCTGMYKEDAFRSAMTMFLHDPPKAIISSSESATRGILEAAYLRGLNIPEDLLVLTLGQDYWNEHTNFPASINTMRPALGMGEVAAKLLIKNINSPILFENQKIILEDKILQNDITLKMVVHKQKKVIPKTKAINILMLESQAATSIQSLAPHFINSTGIDVNIITCKHQYLLHKITDCSENKCNDLDVYMFDIPWLDLIASKGFLADLTNYVESPEFNKDIFIPGCFKHYSIFEGKYYGIPFLYSPQIFFYRKDLFNDRKLQRDFEKSYKTQLRPPRTWLEFNAIAEFFTKALNPDSPVQYGTSVASAYSEFLLPELMPRIWSYMGKVFNNKNKVIFNSPENLKAITNFCKTFEYTSPDFITHDIDRTVVDFYEGKTAMLVCYSAYITEMNDRFKSKIVGKIGYDYIPGKSPVLPGWSLGINPNSKNQDEAFKFINWACGNEISNYCTIMEGQSPLVDLHNNDEIHKLYPWLPLILETYNYCKARKGPYTAKGEIIPQDKLEVQISKTIYSILLDKTPIKYAMATTQHALEQLFESYGYPQN